MNSNKTCLYFREIIERYMEQYMGKCNAKTNTNF